MLQIKIISYPTPSAVEETFKTWVHKSKNEILQVEYSTVLFEEELRHSIMILYKPGSDE